MPVGFSSAARNLWLLGASGQQVVTNFFKQMDASNASVINTTPSAIKYNESDEKYVTAGYNNVNSGPKVGYLEKVQESGTKDWNVSISKTSASGTQDGVFLNNLHIDSSDNLIVCGYVNDEGPFISKYNNDGLLQWQSTSNSGDVEYKSVTSDSNNVYYACGHTQSVAFVEKFDGAGTPGWGKAAHMLGRYVRLNNISTNGRGEVVAVGSLEDDTRDKGYIVKIDTTTGEVMWDRTLDYRDPSPGNISTDKERANVTITRCYIEGNDNIYITGQINSLKGRMFVAKYSPEGNLIWQKMTTNTINVSDGFSEYPFGIYADTETEQISVAYSSGSAENSFIYTVKYSKSGKLLWRRRIDKGTNFFDDNLTSPFGDGLDGSPSFYFLLFQDASDPDTYTFGKVSTAGNGLGNFQYDDGTALEGGGGAFPLINYVYITGDDDVGLLSDGSIRNDTSDFIRYPISPNHIVFDDLATPVSNKKRQMDSADSFEYSGSPAIRPTDFETSNQKPDAITLGDNQFPSSPNWTKFNANDSFSGSGTSVDPYIVTRASGSSYAQVGTHVTTVPGKTYRFSATTGASTGNGGIIRAATRLWLTSGQPTNSLNGGVGGGTNTTITFDFVAMETITTLGLSVDDPGNATFWNLNLQEYYPGIPPQQNLIGLSEQLQPVSTLGSGSSNNTWTRQTSNVTVTANAIANPIGVGSAAELYNISATSGRRLEFGRTTESYKAGVQYTYSWWMKAVTTNSRWAFQALFAGSSNNSIRIADRDGNILETISSGTTNYKPKDTEWHRVVWTFTANNTTSGAIGGYDDSGNTGDMWYLWGAQLVTGSNPGRYNRTIALPTSESGLDYLPSRVGDYWEFDGTDELWTIGEIPGDFSEMTVELWWKTDRLRNWDNPIDCNFHVTDANGVTQSGNIGPRLEINASGTLTWVWGSSVNANDPKFGSIQETVTTGQWYHSVFTIDGPDQTGGRAYLNGEFTGVQTATGTADWGQIGFIKNLVLGRGFALSGTRYFDGQIGEVRIYPRALSAAQVFQNYNSTKSKYINEAPDTAPKISDSAIVYDSNSLLNYDFGNRATYDRAENLIPESENLADSIWSSFPATNAYSDEKVLDPFGLQTAIVPNFTSAKWGLYDHSNSVWFSGYEDGQLYPFTVTDTWQRQSITFTVPAGSTAVRFYPMRRGDSGAYTYYVATGLETGATYTASAYYKLHTDGEKVIAWGCQLNKGSLNRYIKTSGTAITASTKVKNLSSTSFPGTINGATFNPAGYFEFDGTNDYIQSSSVMAPGSTDFSVVFWYKITGTGGRGGLFERAAASPFSGWLIGQGGNNNWSASVRDASNNNATFQYTFPTVDQWTCDAFTWDVSTQTLTPYRNGANAGTATNTGTVGSLDGNTRYPMTIGARLDSASPQYKPMECGEVQMYSKVLTAAEVSQNFNATRSKYGV